MISNKNVKLKFSQIYGVGRIAGSHFAQNSDVAFTGSQTGTSSNNDWSPWEGVILLNLRHHIILGACFYIYSIEHMDFCCSRS